MNVVRDLFKEVSENLNKFSTLLLALIIATTNSMLIKQHKQMALLVWTIVLYSFLVIVGTILQMHNRNLLPIIICGMFTAAGAASFLVLSFFSLSIAIINLVLWVAILTLVVYMYVFLKEDRVCFLSRQKQRTTAKLCSHLFIVIVSKLCFVWYLLWFSLF
ncbi:hypothetical protein VNO80_07378 [Phaseolus coccineus]|uniref:Uncharacterized protein n=1 Tax=Phaseolus coccineus TaxID=3886 RepID=A0AAN9RIF9_PHACN